MEALARSRAPKEGEIDERRTKKLVVDQEGSRKTTTEWNATEYPSITEDVENHFNAYVESVCRDGRYRETVTPGPTPQRSTRERIRYSNWPEIEYVGDMINDWLKVDPKLTPAAIMKRLVDRAEQAEILMMADPTMEIFTTDDLNATHSVIRPGLLAGQVIDAETAQRWVGRDLGDVTRELTQQRNEIARMRRMPRYLPQPMQDPTKTLTYGDVFTAIQEIRNKNSFLKRHDAEPFPAEWETRISTRFPNTCETAETSCILRCSTAMERT